MTHQVFFQFLYFEFRIECCSMDRDHGGMVNRQVKMRWQVIQLVQ